MNVQAALKSPYHAALAMLRQAIEKCSENLWTGGDDAIAFWRVAYGQMTLALVAQAAIHQLRKRLLKPYCDGDAEHLVKDLFHRLEGDVRVSGDTILVSYYNAPEELRERYEGLPDQLARENIDPVAPWLYGYKLDFRFR